MASPAPSNLSADAPPTKAQEQITFRFCRECSNMLYPKEDRMTNKLMFACRTCQFSEEAISSCVFRNNMYNTVGETAGVTQDVGSDPTVGDSDFDICRRLCCTLCGVELGDEEAAMVLREEKHDDDDAEVKGTDGAVFDLSELSRMAEEEDEDVDMDGEPDTTGDDWGTTNHYYGGRGNGGVATEQPRGGGERLSRPPHPERYKAS